MLDEMDRLPEHLHAHQVPFPDDWRTWLVLGGRGAGKTMAGSIFVNICARQDGARIALVGPALHDVREVMIDGPSGVMAWAGTKRPRWEASRRRLVWDNNAVAYAFSAEDPDALRGPQFHAAWGDELCAWRSAETVLGNLRLGLRLGEEPKLLLTTTPRPTRVLKGLLADRSVRVDRAATAVNAGHLSPGFVDSLEAQYGGTRLAAQEIEGLVVEGEGALFRAEDLARCQGARPVELDQVVMAIDPSTTAGGDACGLVIAGRRDERAYVLADASVKGLSPWGWAQRAAGLAETYDVDRIVAEGNQGGEMVRGLLAQAGCARPVKTVYASRSKAARAEPIAALYEQGRVTHCGRFPLLEEEMMALGTYDGRRSPDRADALVWALSDLMLNRPQGPRLRAL